MTERKLASVQIVAEIKPIDGADAIEAIRINGWWVVDKKGLRKVGDKVIYCECDSWIPTALAPFLSKGKEPHVYNEIAGERLRTVKLRGQLSQGLVLDLSDNNLEEGTNLTEILGIIKWEAPAEFKSADAKGSFPQFIPKTDQELIQNIDRSFYRFMEMNPGVTFEVTEKCEGSSMTLFANDGEFGICSRNLQLKEDLTGSSFVDTGIKFKESILGLNKNIAFQGELIGPGIQDNIYNLRQYQYRVFDVYDIDQRRYLSPTERSSIVELIGANIAPVIDAEFIVDVSDENWKDNLLSMADGPTVINPEMGDLRVRHLREGLVFKANTTKRMSFKSISNKYLLKQKD